MASTDTADGQRPVATRLQPGVDFVVRPARESDVPFILTSWRRSYERSPYARAPELGAFMHAIRRAQLAALEHSQVIVAAAPDDDEAIGGWACARPRDRVLHYVFVKDLHGIGRGRGVGRHLVDQLLPPADTRPHFISFLQPEHVRRHSLGGWHLLGRRWSYAPLMIFGEGDTA